MGANKPEYGQRHIVYSTEATAKWFENHSDQWYMAKLIQQLDEKLQQVNIFVESYKGMHQIELHI
jgi:hypothetical protein